MAQLLLISPDETILEAVHQCAVSLGHAVIAARGLRQAQRILGRLHVDLLCLDSVLPERELERFSWWLASDPARAVLPILFLAPPLATFVPSVLPPLFQPERDGQVSKPLDMQELAAEIARLAAASPGRRQPADLLRAGPLTLNLASYQLCFPEGCSLLLTPTEFRLVRYLMERPGVFARPDELLERVWGFQPGTGGVEVVRAHIANLRRKLRAIGQDPWLLRTVPYRGYSLVAGEESSPPAL